MIKLIIKERDEYSNYVLEDINNKYYEVNINFMGIKLPNIGDYIFLDESVLKEKVSLNYGLIDGSVNTTDGLMLLVSDNKKIYLQRFYG